MNGLDRITPLRNRENERRSSYINKSLRFPATMQRSETRESAKPKPKACGFLVGSISQLRKFTLGLC
ncbi:hypothetical protein VNO80_17068 [Phaseolus coccineus]|uniref:Uncharacterized protein n=1 Tax=Phaseolus coccineus TaxID=3886 RepID=A0AAN9MTA0_PHACN